MYSYIAIAHLFLQWGLCSRRSLFLQLVQVGFVTYAVALPPGAGMSVPLMDADMTLKLLQE